MKCLFIFLFAFLATGSQLFAQSPVGVDRTMETLSPTIRSGWKVFDADGKLLLDVPDKIGKNSNTGWVRISLSKGGTFTKDAKRKVIELGKGTSVSEILSRIRKLKISIGKTSKPVRVIGAKSGGEIEGRVPPGSTLVIRKASTYLWESPKTTVILELSSGIAGGILASDDGTLHTNGHGNNFKFVFVGKWTVGR